MIFFFFFFLAKILIIPFQNGSFQCNSKSIFTKIPQTKLRKSATLNYPLPYVDDGKYAHGAGVLQEVDLLREAHRQDTHW